ncbi:MAG TPA: lysophospholipid acyltransferase family protein [Candidatus Angelobacter sp.]|nr:lysophospholipid acyltransferase family protein [Candidatus Angelobacter sp.]
MPETTQAEIKPQEVTRGIRHLGSRLRSYFVWTPLIWLYTAVLGCVSLIVSLFDPTGERQQNVARLWSRMILWTVGAKVQVEGLDKVDISKPQVYVVNHLSAFDIPVLYSYLPFQFRILAKKELFRYPFMGWHLRRSGQIPVVLENPKASVRSLNLAVAAIRKGNSLVIFPEGGRAANGQLQPFMGGAFYAAVKAQVDVVPIVLIGTYEMLKMNSFHIKPGSVQMVVGTPISTAGMSTRDIAKITEQARAVIGDVYYSRCMVPDLRREQPASNEPMKL